jgi:coenzyme PQQ precursor peptide PqqA
MGDEVRTLEEIMKIENKKTWSKPSVGAVDTGLEVTRYLPSTLDVAAKRSCSK